MKPMEDFMQALQSLVGTGEAKIEVSLRLVRETPTETAAARPYDTEGRLDGYRGIAEWLGSSVGFVVSHVRSGEIPVYRIGRKVYAYGDEVMEGLAKCPDKSAAVKAIFSGKGYEVRREDRVVGLA